VQSTDNYSVQSVRSTDNYSVQSAQSTDNYSVQSTVNYSVQSVQSTDNYSVQSTDNSRCAVKKINFLQIPPNNHDSASKTAIIIAMDNTDILTCYVRSFMGFVFYFIIKENNVLATYLLPTLSRPLRTDSNLIYHLWTSSE
jgi:hypothetical protein